MALPATDGVAIVSDTRKWLHDGSYIDGHQKLVSSRDGLLTGTGSGPPLDYVATHASRRLHQEVVLLIVQVAAEGVRRGERAEWTLTVERGPTRTAAIWSHVSVDVFDGFCLKPEWWIPGSLPHGMPAPLIERASECVKAVFDERRSLSEVCSIAVELYGDLYPSGLLSPDFDVGIHRPGRRISIERLRIPKASTGSRSRQPCRAASRAR